MTQSKPEPPRLILESGHAPKGTRYLNVVGSMKRGYVWIGTDTECFGHVSARRLKTFLRKLEAIDAK